MSIAQVRGADADLADFLHILQGENGSTLSGSVQVILDAMAESVVIVDRYYRTVWANATARRFLGLGPDDPLPGDWTTLPGRYLADGKTLAPPDEIPVARALRGEHVASEILLLRHERLPEGAWVSASARPLGAHDGLIVGAIVAWQDITELRYLRSELRSREHRFATLIEHSTDVVFRLDPTLRIVYVSPNIEQVKGLRPVALLGKTGREAGLPEKLWKPFLAACTLVLQSRQSATFEFTDDTRSGVRHFEARLIPEIAAEEELQSILVIVRDRTEEKRAEQALRKSERIAREQLAELEAIYACAPVGLCFVTPDMRLVRLNQSVGEIHDGRVDGAARTVREVLPELAHTLEPILRRVIETGRQILNVELSGETAAAPGIRRYWLASFYPVKADNGSVRGVNVAMLEATDRKRIEEALRDLNQTLEQQVAERTAQLTARAHELRELAVQLTRAEFRESRRIAALLHDELQQTLVAQRMVLERLRETVPADCQQDIGLVYSTATEALEFCRTLTADLSVPALNEPGLPPLLNWLKNRTRQRHGLQLRLIVRGADPDFPFVVKMELYFVLRELFLNVVKHAGVSRATVMLDGSRPGEMVLVVRDRGKGFHPGQNEIWGSSGPGSGIGLTSVRERVGRLGGRMEISSRPGGGTSIMLRFPRSSATPVVPAPAQPGEAGLARPEPPFWVVGLRQTTVLLADDHRLVRTTLRGLLEAGGEFKVVGEARDGVEAVELGLQLKPDVILMDVDMPRMNGIEATRRIRSEAPQIAVVGLSMHDQTSLVDAMRAAGAREYLSKDTDFRRLCQTLRKALLARSLSD